MTDEGERFHGFGLAERLSADSRRLVAQEPSARRVPDARRRPARGRLEDAAVAAEAGRPRRRLYAVTPASAAALSAVRSESVAVPSGPLPAVPHDRAAAVGRPSLRPRGRARLDLRITAGLPPQRRGWARELVSDLWVHADSADGPEPQWRLALSILMPPCAACPRTSPGALGFAERCALVPANATPPMPPAVPLLNQTSGEVVTDGMATPETDDAARLLAIGVASDAMAGAGRPF